MLVSGLTPYEITFIGGYDDSKEEGYGKHQDINPETGQKETIKAEHLNNIELAIKELRDNTNTLVTSILSSYGNLGVAFLAMIGDGSTEYTDISSLTINTSEYYIKEPLSIAVYISNNNSQFTSVTLSDVSYEVENGYITSILLNFANSIDFYYMHIHIYATITDVDIYNDTNGIIQSHNISFPINLGGGKILL